MDNRLGKVDLSLADVVLKPSEKKYDAGLSAKIKDLKAIKEAELKVVVQTKKRKGRRGADLSGRRKSK